jgi:hypothetical protein
MTTFDKFKSKRPGQRPVGQKVALRRADEEEWIDAVATVEVGFDTTAQILKATLFEIGDDNEIGSPLARLLATIKIMLGQMQMTHEALDSLSGMSNYFQDSNAFVDLSTTQTIDLTKQVGSFSSSSSSSSSSLSSSSSSPSASLSLLPTSTSIDPSSHLSDVKDAAKSSATPAKANAPTPSLSSSSSFSSSPPSLMDAGDGKKTQFKKPRISPMVFQKAGTNQWLVLGDRFGEKVWIHVMFRSSKDIPTDIRQESSKIKKNANEYIGAFKTFVYEPLRRILLQWTNHDDLQAICKEEIIKMNTNFETYVSGNRHVPDPDNASCCCIIWFPKQAQHELVVACHGDFMIAPIHVDEARNNAEFCGGVTVRIYDSTKHWTQLFVSSIDKQKDTNDHFHIIAAFVRNPNKTGKEILQKDLGGQYRPDVTYVLRFV